MNPLHAPNSLLQFNFTLLLDVVQHTTLYLLNKYSPNEFLFEDPMNKQHRVKLSNQIQCTCHSGNLGHCIHSLYILLRIYKLPRDSQYVNQTSYTAQDIEMMCKFSEQGFQKKHFIENREFKEIQSKQQRKQKARQWPQFEPDTVCSICYDGIQNQTAIMDCQNCQNYFHTKCLKVWVTQRQRQQCESTCPMCRSPLGTLQQVEKRVKEQQKFYIQYHQSHQIQCCECKKQVLVKLFKCLICEKTFLCAECYYSWKHQNHDKFIAKFSKRGEWEVSTRSQFNIKKLNASLEYLKKFGNNAEQLDFQALMGPKYQQFMQSQVQKPHMLEHLLSCFMDVEKEVHKTYKKIDFGEQQLFCCMCKRKNIVGMRRLLCKHFIDEKCLRFVLKGGFMQCPIDKEHFLPGMKGETVNVI